MSEVLKALDAITERVLAYRPKGKGEAATKVRKRLDRARADGAPTTDQRWASAELATRRRRGLLTVLS